MYWLNRQSFDLRTEHGTEWVTHNWAAVETYGTLFYDQGSKLDLASLHFEN